MGTLYIRASSSAAEDETMLERVQAQLAELQMTYGDRMVMGVTEIEGLLVIRALAYWSEDVIAVFSTLWQSTRHQITGITPDKPRIWAT
jgi:urease accessory protein